VIGREGVNVVNVVNVINVDNVINVVNVNQYVNSTSDIQHSPLHIPEYFQKSILNCTFIKNASCMKKQLILFTGVLLMICSFPVIGQNWSPFPCNSVNYPSAHLDVSGSNLFITRYSPNDVVAYSAANGCQNISSLPDPQLQIRATCIYNGELYVSGYSPVDTTRIYRLTGNVWIEIGKSYQGIVDAMCVYNNQLYVGGWFVEINGAGHASLARWNGSSWLNVGAGINPGGFAHVRSMHVFNNELYIGGDSFDASDNAILKWNGTTMSIVGTGITGYPIGTVFTMHEYNGNLYAGGHFNNAGGVAVYNLAKWNGSAWSAVGGGIGGTDSLVLAMEVFNNELFIGGSFSTPGYNLVKLNGTSLSALSNGGVFNGGVTSLAAFGNSLIVAGSFSWNLSGGILIEYLARYSNCTSSITASGPASFCSGSTFSLTASPGTAFKWQRNGFTLAGATTQTYIPSISGTYSCMITTACGVIPSNSVSVTIYPVPQATITPNGPTTFCYTDSVKLNANTGTGYSYQWIKYGNIITGATGSSYTAKTGGNYKVRVTNSFGCTKKSPAVSVTVNPLPTASITAGGSTSICSGDSVMLTASTNIAGSTYKWKKYANIIPGATSVSYAAKTTGKYKAIVTSPAGCSRSSNSITVTVVCRVAAADFDNEITIYPNPVSDYVFVSGMPGIESMLVEITDITGSLKLSMIAEGGEDNVKIDLNSLPPGIYFLRIQTASVSEIRRLVIQ
jgi:hypothetical protein